jgi:hypothetical protein
MSLFQSSIRLERLIKIVVLIDHKVKHGRAGLTNKQLRQARHDLAVLYDKWTVLTAER